MQEINHLRLARLQAGIATQRELSSLSGIHPSIISDLERGKRKLNPTWAIKLGKVLGCDWQVLHDSSHGIRPR